MIKPKLARFLMIIPCLFLLACQGEVIQFATIEEMEGFVITSLEETPEIINNKTTLKLDQRGDLSTIGEVYFRIQDRIAQAIPKESLRPPIELTLGALGTTAEDGSIGLLGGMGPLSDAQILKKVLEKLDQSPQRAGIHLLSLPPPRDMSDFFDFGFHYLTKIYSFFGKDYLQYFLLSNAAHKYRPLALQFLDASIFDLPGQLSKSLASKKERILILATDIALDSSLYSEPLRENGLDVVFPSEEDQAKINEWIGRIKKADLGPGDRKQLIELIKSLASESSSSVILFGCTEFSLAIPEYSHHRLSPYDVVDSESFLVQNILQSFYLFI